MHRLHLHLPHSHPLPPQIKVKEVGIGPLKMQRPQVYFRIETTDKKGDVRYSVSRKLDDFQWLHSILQPSFPELPVPSLPPPADLKNWQPSVMARVRGNLNYFVQVWGLGFRVWGFGFWVLGFGFTLHAST